MIRKQYKFLFSWFVLISLLSACGVRQLDSPGLQIATEPAATEQFILPEDVSQSTSTPEEALDTSVPVESQEAGVPTVTTGPTPVPTAEPVVGLHVHNLNSLQELDLFQQAEAFWVRFDDVQWDEIEPQNQEPPVYNWDVVNEEGLRNAADRGMKTIGIVLFAPEWAQKYPGATCGPLTEEGIARFAQFMKAAVERYSQPPFNVHVWEIGNEPDIDRRHVPPRIGFGCWGEMYDSSFGGGAYADMLKVVYPAIKEADPTAEVLIGGLLLDCDPVNPPETRPGSGQPKDCSASQFLEGILQNGGGDYFDAISFHAYDYYGNEVGIYGNGNWHSAWNTTGPVLIAKANYIKNLLASYGYSDKGLLNTEVALLCVPEETNPACSSEDFVTTKAYYAAEANALALATGLDANVWYSLSGWRHSGLIDASLQPNNALQAFRFSGRQLEGASYVGEVTTVPEVKGLEFQKNEKRFWILWGLDNAEHSIDLLSTPQAVYDVYGSPMQIETQLQISRAPVYVEWSVGE